MKIENSTAEPSLGEKITEGVKRAVTEIEEFRLQLALGKMEAHDLYEETKDKFNEYLRDSMSKAQKFASGAAEIGLQVKAGFETLQLQLALGKAETKEAFEEQRQRIVHALHELEVKIRNQKVLNEYYSALLIELNKFKIKLDILKLRYELRKLEASAQFEDRKKELTNYLENIRSKFLKPSYTAADKLNHIHDELGLAFQHLKKAFA
jgi:hypothetical protein